MVVVVLLLVVMFVWGSIKWDAWSSRRNARQPVKPVAYGKGTVELHDSVLELQELDKYNRVTKHVVEGIERSRAQSKQRVVDSARHEPDPFQQGLRRNGVFYSPPQLEPGVELGATAPETGTKIALKEDEPQELKDYQGQSAITTNLQLNLQAMRPEQRLLRHMLITGLPGFGKTLLAKLIARELQTRSLRLRLGPVEFVETYGANLNSVAALDQVVDRIRQASAVVWFIDEIHVMNIDMATKIYLLMEEGRYPFAGSLQPTELPPVMVIGATTDYGALHPALKRRFGEPFLMQPLPQEVLVSLAKQLLPTASDSAVQLLAQRCKFSGAPHELKTLCYNVQVYADANRLSSINDKTVLQVCETWGIDEYGLRPIDRRVIQLLKERPRHRARDNALVGYGASEADICNLAGIDRSEFQKVIRPRLMSRNLISVRPGMGLALTDTALSWYP